MRKNLHEGLGFGEMAEAVPLLRAITAAEHTLEPPVVVDFTFRLPAALLEEIKTMAREENLSANAMVAGLVDIGLRQRGRQGIAERYPDYVSYLTRRRKR